MRVTVHSLSNKFIAEFNAQMSKGEVYVLVVYRFCSFYAPQLYRQVLLRRVLAMGILSVCLSEVSRPGVEHCKLAYAIYQAQVRQRLLVSTI